MDKEAGRKLRQIRQRLGISTTQVAEMSSRLAQAEGNGEFLLSTARLAQIENAGSAPSLHKLYALAIIYRVRFSDLLRLYGLDLSKTPAHLRLFQPAGTVPAQVELLDPSGVVSFPVRFDPGFDRRATQFMNQVVEAWGEIPLALLERLNPRRRLYGYIGIEDRTMYPLLRPGSFVVIDDEQAEVAAGGWGHEFDRPIYFVELRRGYRCAWCQLEGSSLILIPHPLSGCRVQTFPFPDEAEIMGRVTGVAMRLVDGPEKTGAARRELPRQP